MIVERTAVVPLPMDETWEVFFGNEMQNWRELSDMVVEIRDYRMRADGTPVRDGEPSGTHDDQPPFRLCRL